MTQCGCTEVCRMGWDDQFQPATREVLVFTKAAKRYFDLDAVREPFKPHRRLEPGAPTEKRGAKWDEANSHRISTDYTDADFYGVKTAGAPPLDWWQIPSPKPQPISPYEGPPMTATMYIGDALDVLGKLPENSVDLVLSSPPFLALRSYLPSDHPLKAKEGGSQSTPGEYIDWLLDVVEACDRVLAPHGSLCFELGDTYAGSGGAGGDYGTGGIRQGQPMFRQGSPTSQGHIPRQTEYGANLLSNSGGQGWPLPKSLSLIPESFRFAMVYGFNPFTGRQTERWRLRNVIRWVRPNPPVGALCVDDSTEALTPDGWRTHDQLQDGDLVASYDLKTDSIRFLPATFVRYEREGEPMVVIDKKATSQWFTEWHRCLVKTRKGGVQVKLAQDLTNDCETLLCAPFEDVAGPAPVTTERAALLGWYIAEGSPHHRQARIVQSVTANPNKVERIRSLLDRDGADYRETTYARPGSTMATFTIKGELAEWLNLHHKRLPMAYVTTWPEAQALNLFDALIDGDGHRRKGRGVLFHQKDEAIADAVQVLAIRLGYRASKFWQPTMNLWQITMSMAPVKDRRWTKIRKWEGEGIRREFYTGTVWCPQVETGFWLARRNGKTFVTGNSDKFRPATSELMVFCKSAKRYFDLDAVREGLKRPESEGHSRIGGAKYQGTPGDGNRGGTETGMARYEVNRSNPAGAPPLDWWNIPPGGFSGAHYAVWPPELLIKPIKAMCPEQVCRTCGEARRRVVGSLALMAFQPEIASHIKERRLALGISQREVNDWFPGKSIWCHRWEPGSSQPLIPRPEQWAILKTKLGLDDRFDVYIQPRNAVTYEHISDYPSGNTQNAKGEIYQRLPARKDRISPDGFTDCGHDNYRPGLVLDPFVGSGTTLAVATGHGRDAIGIDLDARNFDLALERVGPLVLQRGEVAA